MVFELQYHIARVLHEHRGKGVMYALKARATDTKVKRALVRFQRATGKRAMAWMILRVCIIDICLYELRIGGK